MCNFLCSIFLERKIANLTSEQLLNLSRLDDVDEEDEDEASTPEAEPVAVAITVSFFCVRKEKRNLSYLTIELFSQVTTVPTAQHPSIVRTAKAEKRLKDKLTREVSFRENRYSLY